MGKFVETDKKSAAKMNKNFLKKLISEFLLTCFMKMVTSGTQAKEMEQNLFRKGFFSSANFHLEHIDTLQSTVLYHFFSQANDRIETIGKMNKFGKFYLHQKSLPSFEAIHQCIED